VQQTVPDKLYFRIGEVAELARLKPSVLRFWETQFPLLLPHKTTSGQRRYAKDQLLLVLELRRLLYDEKLTIAGALQRLMQAESLPGGAESAREQGQLDLLREIRLELEEIRDLLLG